MQICFNLFFLLIETTWFTCEKNFKIKQCLIWSNFNSQILKKVWNFLVSKHKTHALIFLPFFTKVPILNSIKLNRISYLIMWDLISVIYGILYSLVLSMSEIYQTVFLMKSITLLRIEAKTILQKINYF